ncbi:heterokaryon incompatibility protein-domain-containing protein [Hyaloscypha finlandica]|nr:heterokaryon incompatibility protein-domain-containing protein [Hyaloscypha finlandica]
MILPRVYHSTIEIREGSNQRMNPSVEGMMFDEAAQKLDEIPETCNESGPEKSLLYSDLQDSDEIRLLCLEPRSSGDKIECTIKHVKFSDSPVYEALSYMWGPQNVLQYIVVSGNNILVRENLWSALQHLRLESENRVLWIDAMCINQQNIHERNHQVAQMRMIYKQARRVVVWLGPSDPLSVLGFQSLNNPGEWMELTGSSKNPLTRSEGNKRLGAICSLFTRQYWNRLWVIQEFLLARELILQCGNHQCTGFRISWFMLMLGLTTEVPGENDTSDWVERISISNAIRNSAGARLIHQREPFQKHIERSQDEGKSTRGSLLRMFSMYKEAECEKQVDKIFGLAGLADTCCSVAVTIDYSSTLSKILPKVILHHLCVHTDDETNYVQRVCEPREPSSTWQRHIEYTRQLYQEMKMVSQYFKDPRLDLSNTLSNFSEGFLSYPNEPIWVTGYLRGRIIYTSPPLSTDFDKNLSYFPSLPERCTAIAAQLEYIGSLLDSPEGIHPLMTTEASLVGTVDEGRMRQKFSITTLHLSQHKDGTYWDSGFGEKSHPPRDIAQNFQKLLRIAKTTFLREQQDGCRLAFEDNGLVLFVDEKTCVGDYVCQFPNTNTMVTLDRGNMYSTYYSVRRAVNFLACPSNVAVNICGKEASFEDLEPSAIAFHVYPEGLRRLCCHVDKSPSYVLDASNTPLDMQSALPPSRSL